MTAKRYRFQAADGTTYTWSREQLDDTILENAAWDTPATVRKIDALKVGQSITRKGETLTRIRASNPSSSSTSSKPRKRPPIAESALRALSEHGRVLDLVVDNPDGHTRRYTFGDRPLLCWSERASALVWWEGLAMPRARAVNRSELPTDARSAWERFHGADAGTLRTADTPELGQWRTFGMAVAIGYRNPQRWGKDDAQHDFTSTVRVYRARGRKPYLWILRGGSLRVTARGIEG